ncbi:hypothetical protein F5Y15DRAFT_144501 [Xylariaceae sp. FL0016]|nr:hypothetical protein F5Y15DRAFT_144501 [Xylariaceae sp. FL0016]
MGISGILPVAFGLAAILETAAVLALNLVLATGLALSNSPARIAAIVASAMEGIELIIIAVLLSSAIRRFMGYGSGQSNGAWFAVCLVASLLASASTVVLLVTMGKAADLPKIILQTPAVNFLIGSSIALGFAFAGQLIFIVVRFVVHRMPDTDQAMSLHTNDEWHRTTPTLPMHVKSVPYSRTKVATPQQSRSRASSFNLSPPGTSSGYSGKEPFGSIRSSLSSVVRPIDSKTRLLSTRSASSRTSKMGTRTCSIDSSSYRDRSSVAEDGFDSWDTSSVDPQNRQMVLDSSSPVRTRFLETIPASPTTSRSPSPGFPLDLPLPSPAAARHRSRSYSPVPRIHQERTLTPQASDDELELHIHPLFRSDSPAPPQATPGTIVVAAPGAGQLIAGESISRMRSGSLPTAGSIREQQHQRSPLSRQGSCDEGLNDGVGGAASATRSSSNGTTMTPPSPNATSLAPGELDPAFRKMTPPIPEWILSAGARTSLTEYQSRKLQSRDLTP